MSSASASPAVPKESAARRLQRDLQELRAHPLPNMTIEVGQNFFEWSVNLVAQEGAWAGIPVHLHLTFPPDYPRHAPRADLVTDLYGHPNVFGQYICLDMLKDPEYYSKPFQGWSSAYTASTLLAQLYGFLLVDDVIDQDWGGRRERQAHGTIHQRREAAHAVLNACPCGFKALPTAGATDTISDRGSTGTAPASAPASSAAGTPPSASALSSAPASPRSALSSSTFSTSASFTTTATGGTQSDSSSALLGPSLDVLDDHTLRLTLGRLGATDLWQCIGAGGRMGRVARDVLQRSELLCFHSKVSYTEAVLGFGVSRQWHGSASTSSPAGGSNGGSNSTSNLKGLSSKTDLLSLAAFRDDGARMSAWNIPFDAFLPLYLNPEHGQRSLLELPACVRGMLSRGCASGYMAYAQGGAALKQLVSTQEGASDLLQVLAQLINSFVVDVVAAGGMGGCSAGSTAEATVVGRNMSDAALQGFCHLHHLLLAAALEPRSVLVQQARKDVRAFVADEAARHKSRCPDLGLLLVKYMLVPREEVPWAAFAPAFLRELLARQVRWVLQAPGTARSYGQPYTEVIGACGETEHDHRRLKDQFESSLTSMRNVMLQAWFANALARPKSSATCLEDLRTIKAAYDECSGLPPPRAFGSFNAHARAVMGCGSWTQCLKHLRLGLLADRHPKAQFVAMLRQAVLDSHSAGYHRAPNPYVGAPQPLAGSSAAAGGARRAGPPPFVNWAKQPVGVLSDSWL